MKKTNKLGLLGIFACLCALVLVLAGCGSSESTESSDDASGDTATTEGGYTLIEDGVITCASDLECPPFSSYKEGTSEPEGFEIDLMAAVAEKMGLESKWVPKMDFDAVLNQIPEGTKFDVAVANISITEERKEVFDFTDPYYVANIAFVTKADTTATSPEDFDKEGMRIGVQAGTTGEAWAKENLTNAEIVTMIPANAMSSVRASEDSEDALDAMLCDLPVANSYISQTYSDLKVLKEIATGDEFGIGVSKNNPELTKAINKALAELQEDGTIDELVQKWLA